MRSSPARRAPRRRSWPPSRPPGWASRSGPSTSWSSCAPGCEDTLRLGDYLAPERIVVPLEGETLGSAVQVLAERLVASGHVLHPERLLQRVQEQRPEDIVALDGRAFILHYRTDAVRALGVALGRAAAAVRRDLGTADDHKQEARVVVLIVSPPRQAPRHLQVLRAFARILSDPGELQHVFGAADARDLAALPSFAVGLPDQLSVRDLMSEQPRTTTPETALMDAAHQLLRGRLGALPVVDGSFRLVGMLSERELLRDLVATVPLGGGKGRPGTPASTSARTVRDVMTRQVLAVGPDQPLAEVAALMSNRDVERVPVVDEGRLVGFLTRGDLVRKLVGA